MAREGAERSVVRGVQAGGCRGVYAGGGGRAIGKSHFSKSLTIA